MLFDADLLTYRGIYKTIKTDKLNIPTCDGRRTILSNHMPIMIPLIDGLIETNENGELCHYAISDGMLYFEDNKAKIICDVIEDIKSVDVKIYEKKLEEAKHKLENANDDIEIKKATVKITRANTIINAVKGKIK